MPAIIKTIGPPGCLSRETVLCFRRGKRHSGRQETIEDAFHKFNRIPRSSIAGGKNNRLLARHGAKYLWSADIETQTHSLIGNGLLSYEPIEQIVYSGVKETFTLETETGKSIRVTEEHPFRVPDGTIGADSEGFKRLCDLSVGDYVMCRSLEVTKNGRNTDKRKKRREVSGIEWHPFASLHTVNGCTYRRLTAARIVFEAYCNMVSVEKYIADLKMNPRSTTKYIFIAPSFDVHHKDEDTLNDVPENLQAMLQREHVRLHGIDHQCHFQNVVPKAERITSITRHGFEDTYDLTMKGPDKNYVANDFIVHNTGKSTELLRLITQDAEQFGSSRIGAVSFTTSAVHTIADRIVQAGHDLPDNVRTIHSHCYRLLGIKDGEVADTKKHLAEFGARYPHWKMSEKAESIEDRGTTEEQVTGEAKRLRVNDQLFNNMQVLRNRLAPLDQWPDFEKEIYKDWQGFMQDEGLIDFTGMMERVLENELMVYLDSLFVDEAQDLSALSMAILMMWAEHTKFTTFFGDSDQCVYKFSGVNE